MLLPSTVLVVACLLVGIFPEYTVGPVLATAARSILGEHLPSYELAVWHGVTAPFFMSMVALAGGVAFYIGLVRGGRSMVPTPGLSRINAARAFDILDVAAIRSAARAARLLFSSRLQPQVLLIVCAALAAGFLPLVIGGWSAGDASVTRLDPLFVLLWLIGGACALGASIQAKFHRLAALIMVGVVGLITCLTFAWFSAPDLALTQIVVETVTAVLILLGLRWLPRRLEITDPRRTTLRARARRARDTTLAVLCGAGVAALSYGVLTRRADGELGPFFLRHALEPAGGLNVVNVTLVDFRGFDTLGEITVLGIVAMTVYALLRRFRPAPESLLAPSAQRGSRKTEGLVPDADALLPSGDLNVPAVLVRALLPMAGMVSVYFLLRGHQAPGGGFVGGLVMATAVIAQYMVGGTIWVESRLRVHPLTWMGLGLLAAVAAGTLAWWSSLPFLTARTTALDVPVLGRIELSSVLLFDVGVYMLVVGATLLMLVVLAHQSLRTPRQTVTPLSSEDNAETPISSRGSL